MTSCTWAGRRTWPPRTSSLSTENGWKSRAHWRRSPNRLLLDEVFAGLNPAEVEEALNLVMTIKRLGITLMIVEHVIKIILGVSHRVLVLSSGVKIFEGPPEEAIKDQRVVKAYLGEDFYA